MDNLIIVALIGFASTIAGGAIVGFFQWNRNKKEAKKSEAETTKILVDAANALLKPYQDEVVMLRNSNSDLKQELERACGDNKELRKAMEKLRISNEDLDKSNKALLASNGKLSEDVKSMEALITKLTIKLQTYEDK